MHELGFDEVLLANVDGRNQTAVKWLTEAEEKNEISVSETDTEITLKASDFTYAISKRTGLFTKLQYAGRDYLNHPMELNIWRAPTDNDMYIRAKWENAHFHEAYTRAYKVETIQNQYGVIVMSHVGVVCVYSSTRIFLRLRIMAWDRRRATVTSTELRVMDCIAVR